LVTLDAWKLSPWLLSLASIMDLPGLDFKPDKVVEVEIFCRFASPVDMQKDGSPLLSFA
jgi:hypothetical protein